MKPTVTEKNVQLDHEVRKLCSILFGDKSIYLKLTSVSTFLCQFHSHLRDLFDLFLKTGKTGVHV